MFPGRGRRLIRLLALGESDNSAVMGESCRIIRHLGMEMIRGKLFRVQETQSASHRYERQTAFRCRGAVSNPDHAAVGIRQIKLA